jgi:hypothetical protein
MGSSCSSEVDLTQPENVEKRWQMVQLFRGIRGYGRKRYVSVPCQCNQK